jgi:hypothetical protein
MFFPAKNNKSGKAALSDMSALSLRNKQPCSESPEDELKITGLSRLTECRTDHPRSNGIVIDFVNDNKAARSMVVLILVAHQRLMHF